MANWKDVRNFLETGEDIPRIPEGTEMYPVVGLSFIPGYPDNVYELAKLRETGVYITRNPENPYDGNAIEVHSLNGMLGHLSKEVAARLAPLMDSGTTYVATVYQVRVSPENPNNPGLDILLEEINE